MATIMIIIKINFLFILKINITTTISRRKGSKNKYISLQKEMISSFV